MKDVSMKDVNAKQCPQVGQTPDLAPLVRNGQLLQNFAHIDPVQLTQIMQALREQLILDIQPRQKDVTMDNMEDDAHQPQQPPHQQFFHLDPHQMFQIIQAVREEVGQEMHEQLRQHPNASRRGQNPSPIRQGYFPSSTRQGDRNGDGTTLPPLTPEGREYLRANDGCFRCRELGHWTQECPCREAQNRRWGYGRYNRK